MAVTVLTIQTTHLYAHVVVVLEFKSPEFLSSL